MGEHLQNKLLLTAGIGPDTASHSQSNDFYNLNGNHITKEEELNMRMVSDETL